MKILVILKDIKKSRLEKPDYGKGNIRSYFLKVAIVWTMYKVANECQSLPVRLEEMDFLQRVLIELKGNICVLQFLLWSMSEFYLLKYTFYRGLRELRAAGLFLQKV